MRRLLTCLIVLAVAIGLGFAARTWLFSAVRIAGSSMEDTLLSGDVVLVTRWDAPTRGSIMQCSFPGRSGSYVKRVIGLPGDVVEFRDGQLIVNNNPIAEPYVSSETEDMNISLSADEYFVLGDNRAESYDSRAEDMGCIHSEQFLGRVRWILWPINRFGPVE